MVRGTDITDAKKAYRTRTEGDFPYELNLSLRKEYDLKYGENPIQKGAIYRDNGVIDISSIRSDGKGKGGLSLTNMMDITRAMDTLKFFRDDLAVAIMKHATVSGFAKEISPDQKMIDLFRSARDADLRSNFGGTAVFSKPLDMETARSLYELKGKSPFFVDVLAAPGFDEGVIGYLESKSKNLRIGEFSGLYTLPRFQGDDSQGLYSFKELPGGLMGVQDVYLPSIKSVEDLIFDPMIVSKKTGKRHIVSRDPTQREVDDLLTAWYLNIAGARSNGIVIVKNGISVAMGSGQVERVGAIEQAIVKGMQKAMDREGIKYDPLKGIDGYKRTPKLLAQKIFNWLTNGNRYGPLSENPFNGAVCSSDAFFPFRDSLDILARVGVSAIVQPYGSIRDSQVIDAANEHNMAMPATLERCFGHF